MTDTTVPAASQPAPQAQTSVEKSANISLTQLARQFAASDAAKGAENIPAAPAAETTPESPANSPETAPAVPAETAEATPLISPPEEPVAEPQAADEALSHETSLAPELQAVIDKRIGKEVAKRKALEAELAQLRGKVTPEQPASNQPVLPPIVIAPTAEQPLANIHDFAALEKVAADTRQIKYLAQEGLDAIDTGAAETFVINDKAYSKAELKNIVRNASRSLEEQIPQRNQFIQQRLQSVQRALQINPDLGVVGSEAHVAALSILRDPSKSYLHYVPNSLEQIALMIEGQKALSTRAKPAQSKPKPVAPTKAPASQVAFGAAATGSTRASASAQSEGALADEMKKLSGKGGASARDVARFLSRKEQLTSTRS